MKTFAWIMAVVLVCLAGVAQADVVPGNLVANGDFHTDLSSWTNLGTWATWTSNTPDGGGMLITEPGKEPYQDAFSSLFTPATYTMQLDAYSPDATESLVMRLWYNGSTVIGPSLLVSADSLNAGWGTYSIDYVVPTGHETQFLEMTIDTAVSAGAGEHYYVDNVSVVKTPEPATMVLLASGLIGLLCYAWRKRR